jgi:hypothetical protein
LTPPLVVAREPRIAMSDHDDFGGVDGRAQILDQQAIDVGQMLLEEGAVAAVDAGQVDAGVVDGQREPLAQQALRQLEERALAQVVRAGLERQAE